MALIQEVFFFFGTTGKFQILHKTFMSESIVLLQKKKILFFQKFILFKFVPNIGQKGAAIWYVYKKKPQNTFWIIVYIYFFFFFKQPRDQDTYKLTIFILFFHF